jgi:tetratricopeptide (TPR) repeat protein
MTTSSHQQIVEQVAALAEEYRSGGDRAVLISGLLRIAESDDSAALKAAAEPYRDVPEIAGPLYERVVALEPDNARAMVILANAYWLTGRGPDVVGELASRALSADPANRGAWHLWALTESDPRERTIRWRQVTERFPDDDLARANLADNAASLAGAEHDREALALAIREYETLLSRAQHLQQREALEQALMTLRAWSF